MAMMFWHSLDPIQVSGKMIRDHKEKLQLTCRMSQEKLKSQIETMD
jgi:hypothetical protein